MKRRTAIVTVLMVSLFLVSANSFGAGFVWEPTMSHYLKPGEIFVKPFYALDPLIAAGAGLGTGEGYGTTATDGIGNPFLGTTAYGGVAPANLSGEQGAAFDVHLRGIAQPLSRLEIGRLGQPHPQAVVALRHVGDVIGVVHRRDARVANAVVFVHSGLVRGRWNDERFGVDAEAAFIAADGPVQAVATFEGLDR